MGEVKIQYDGIKERVFTIDHPEVIAITQEFKEKVMKLRIFEKFEAVAPISLRRAEVVGSAWHAFSAFVPWLLCHASTSVSTNRMRHYVIQTAFEELGMRDEKEIHHEMYWSAAKLAGLTDTVRDEVEAHPLITTALKNLEKSARSLKSDGELMGFLLGMEIPAVENIETVLSSLAHNSQVRPALENSQFFLLHRQIETEHVRLAVSTFLRFCGTEAMKVDYKRGFDLAVSFWSEFWGGLGEIMKERPRSKQAS